LSWLDDNPGITDFSTEVLPYFIEKIATWKNKGIHRDIGTLQILRLAQADPKPEPSWIKDDEWKKVSYNNQSFRN